MRGARAGTRLAASFRYFISQRLIPRKDGNGRIAAAEIMVSTGRVRGVQRTVRANLRRRGFLDYLYMTDFESLDPLSGYYSDPTTAANVTPRAACKNVFFCALHGNDGGIEPHEQARGLDAVDTTTYFRR